MAGLIYSNKLQVQNNYSGEPTGFDVPENVIITGDNTTRTVTLTGSNWNAYYNGILNNTIVSGWTSSAHDTDTAKVYFLLYDGSTISWEDVSTLAEDRYKYLLIALAFYNSTDGNWVYQRECHGLMNWQAHREFHDTIGTYKESGGTLGDYTEDSTTAADRRPSVTAALIYDEDLPSTVTAITAGTGVAGDYSQFYLSGAGATANIITTASEIVPLSGNRPYFNEFTGGSWQQTLMTNNDYMNVYLLAVPMAADTDSQKLRYLWVQGQTQYATEEEALGETTQDLSLGTFIDLTPESIFVVKVTIVYTAANWKITNVEALTGNRYNQVGSPQGNYLSTVTTGVSLDGLGTVSSPLEMSGIFVPDADSTTSYQFFKTDGVTPVLTIDTTNGVIDSLSGYTLNGTNINIGGTLDNVAYLDQVNTFTEFPITPSSAPTADYEMANKKYVDDATKTLYSQDTYILEGRTDNKICEV